ncbi:unnamed protein product, partial [Rotaria socialis]
MQRHQLLFEYGKFCKLCSLPCLQKAQKQILTNVSGIFRTGMNAIMGPTGCGKASLLDLLADRKDREGFEGGERKRTNIGMELVLSPRILFLDEPTTGRDSSMARSVMECLHQLSRTGCTIVFSIHQPRYSIFKLFDTLFLLSAGRCTYHGPTD